jgi:transposase
VNWRPRKKVPSHGGDTFGKFSFGDALARKTNTPCNFAMDRWRHLIETFFCNGKQWHGIAIRYDKTARRFAAMINLTAPVMALK